LAFLLLQHFFSVTNNEEYERNKNDVYQFNKNSAIFASNTVLKYIFDL
jgi:hypothetical protein